MADTKQAAPAAQVETEEMERYGFRWDSGVVQYDPNKGQKIALGDAPHATVTDVAKFESNFPGVILDALNGTSIKVRCQAVTRRALLRDRKTPWETMQQAVFQSLKGIRSRGAVVTRRETFYVVGGKKFTTLEDANNFGREILTAKGLDSELIESILIDLVREEEAAK